MTKTGSCYGAGSPPDRHPREDEGFCLLDGRFAFGIEGGQRVVGPGEWFGR